jgi:signal transduction histidine kinase
VEVHAARPLRPGGDEDPHASRRRSWLVSGVAAVGLQRWARLAALLLVVALIWARGAQPLLVGGLFSDEAFGDWLPFTDGVVFGDWLVAGVLAAYILLTLLLPRQRLLQGADLLVAAALVLVAGADVAPYLPFVLVAVAGPAAREGLWAGMAAGGLLGSLLLVSLAFAGEPAAIGMAGAIATILLPPLAGVTAAAAGEVLEDRSLRDRHILQEANRLLSSLQAIADEVPGGLDVSSVAANLMNEVRGLQDVRAAMLLCEDGTGYRQVGRTGRAFDLRGHVLQSELVPAISGGTVLVSRDELPGPLRASFTDVPHLMLLPMGNAAVPSSALLVGFDTLDAARNARHLLQPLADDATLALDNARLFDGTRTRAVDAARRQLASDLHDGVAQSLAHLRMELELLSLRDPNGGETERLAEVAGSALVDLRRMISGLRVPRDDGLAARLEQHIRSVRTPHGPRLDLIVIEDPPLDGATIEEIFRVAQEAMSNALRHADASEITVVLDRAPEGLILRVEDDGIGIDPQQPGRATGVGLGSMHDRAARLQGKLRIDAADHGGTRVELRVPSRPQAPLPTTGTGS